MNSSHPVALIAGANGGVGQALAAALLRESWNLALLSRTRPIRQKVSGSAALPAQTAAFQADLGSASQANKAVAEIWRTFGRIDMVINTVGGWIGGKRLHEHSADEFERMLAMDLRPTFYLMAAVLPFLQRQKSGKIINFGSVAALDSTKGNAVYAASKAGVLTLTRAIAAEYREDGIEAYVFAPGLIATPANCDSMPAADSTKWVGLDELAQAVLNIADAGPALSGTVFRFTTT